MTLVLSVISPAPGIGWLGITMQARLPQRLVQAVAAGVREGTHQGFCHVMKQRSGCGMIARWRPFAEVSAAIPSGEPLGLKG